MAAGTAMDNGEVGLDLHGGSTLLLGICGDEEAGLQPRDTWKTGQGP